MIKPRSSDQVRDRKGPGRTFLGSSSWENGLRGAHPRKDAEPKMGFQIVNPAPPFIALDKPLIFSKPQVPHLQNGYNTHGVVKKVKEYCSHRALAEKYPPAVLGQTMTFLDSTRRRGARLMLSILPRSRVSPPSTHMWSFSKDPERLTWASWAFPY